jgi:NADH dehydrogenase/NADH:ubiquinone oxidoreductase subunit G
MNRGDRIEAPLLAHGRDLAAVDWDHALDRAAQIIKGCSGKGIALVSPGASLEALWLTRQVFAGLGLTAAFRVERVKGEAPLAGVPDLALREERAPNATGARLLGYSESFDAALKNVDDAALVIVLDEGLAGVPASALSGAANLIYLGTVLPEAARSARVVLPIANVAEEDGTFVNRDRRVQRYFQAKASPGMARPAWWVLGELLRGLGRGESLGVAGDAFDALAKSEPAFAGMSYAAVGLRGAVAGASAPAGAGA